MLRTRERMQELFAQSESSGEFRGARFVEQADRVERQAVLLLARCARFTSRRGCAAASSRRFVGLVWTPERPSSRA
jgi:hypothetical protein